MEEEVRSLHWKGEKNKKNKIRFWKRYDDKFANFNMQKQIPERDLNFKHISTFSSNATTLSRERFLICSRVSQTSIPNRFENSIDILLKLSQQPPNTARVLHRNPRRHIQWKVATNNHPTGCKEAPNIWGRRKTQFSNGNSIPLEFYRRVNMSIFFFFFEELLLLKSGDVLMVVINRVLHERFYQMMGRGRREALDRWISKTTTTTTTKEAP